MRSAARGEPLFTTKPLVSAALSAYDQHLCPEAGRLVVGESTLDVSQHTGQDAESHLDRTPVADAVGGVEVAVGEEALVDRLGGSAVLDPEPLSSGELEEGGEPQQVD